MMAIGHPILGDELYGDIDSRTPPAACCSTRAS
jgi:23S rRNA-/tRNA-specific pseudouridylate synthase